MSLNIDNITVMRASLHLRLTFREIDIQQYKVESVLLVQAQEAALHAAIQSPYVSPGYRELRRYVQQISCCHCGCGLLTRSTQGDAGSD